MASKPDLQRRQVRTKKTQIPTPMKTNKTPTMMTNHLWQLLGGVCMLGRGYGIGLAVRAGLLFLGLMMGLSACRDNVQTAVNPNPPTDSISVRPLALRLFANQQVRISIPDSLGLRGSFTQQITSTDLGDFSVDSVNGAPISYFKFSPKRDTVGTASVIYTVCNGSNCKSSYISIDIRPMSSCVIAANTDTLTVLDQDADSMYLGLNDQICSGVSYSLVGPAPQFGNVTLNATTGLLTYFADPTKPPTPETLSYEIRAAQQVTKTAAVVINRKPSCLLDAQNDDFVVNLATLPRLLLVTANDQACSNSRIVIETQPSIGRVTVVNNEVLYSASITANPGTTSFTYHLERAGYRSRTARVDLRLLAQCVTRLAPTSWNVAVQSGPDSVSLVYLMKRAFVNPNYSLCPNTTVSILSISQMHQSNRIVVSPTGDFEFNIRVFQTSPIIIRYGVRDNSTNITVSGVLTVNVFGRQSCTSQMSIPDVTISDSLMVEADLEQIILRQGPQMQCTPIIHQGSIVTWSGLPSGNLITRNFLNPNQSRISFRRAQGTSGPYRTPQNTPIIYTVQLADLNGRVVQGNTLTGRIFIQIN